MKTYTVCKGSIIMPKGCEPKIARVGDVLTSDHFKGYEKNLVALLKGGNLREGRVAVPAGGLDTTRGVGDFAPVPRDREDGSKPRELTSRTKDKNVKAKLDEIKRQQAKRAETQAKLAEHEGEEMTLAEAQANGIA